ncbi:MAG: diguanylate cyclase [Planctomycetes bacterium]|nr:diguanylate cyclase [Planctomycetota bacterium]
MRILLAHTEASFLSLEALLAGWGYEVVLAQDGRAALQVLQGEHPPKLAFLDRFLPDRDSLELCREVRRADSSPYIYLILLAPEQNPADLVAALDAGADLYLSEPLDADQLRAYLQAARRILDLQDELIAALEALREQAARDSLTGLWNHGAILEILQHEWERSQRLGHPLGVIMADLDYFKSINDQFGHLGGDQVLKQVARRLESTLRHYDWIGRYGGEEFLVVLPGCDTPTTLLLAERLRKSISGKALLLPEGPVPLSISVGVCACSDPHRADVQSLLRAADTALYRAKDSGRNRVERALPPDLLERRSG